MTPRGPARAPRAAGLESAGTTDMGAAGRRFKAVAGGSLGTVAELVAAWRLGPAIAGAAGYGAAYEAALGCRVAASRRARTMAGAAHPETHRIVLNAALLLPGREAERDATLLHECAHVIADLDAGRRCHHGPRWRAVMRALGQPPLARHAIPYLSRAAHAVVVWVCTGCGREHPFVRRPRRPIEACRCRRCGPERGRLVAVPAGPAAGRS